MNIKRNWIQANRMDRYMHDTYNILLVVLNRIQFVSHRKKDGFYLDCLQTIAMLSCSLRCVPCFVCACACACMRVVSVYTMFPQLNFNECIFMNPKFIYAFRLPLSVYPVWFQCRHTQCVRALGKEIIIAHSHFVSNLTLTLKRSPSFNATLSFEYMHMQAE